MNLIKKMLTKFRQKPWYERLWTQLEHELRPVKDTTIKSTAAWFGKLTSAMLDVYLGKYLPTKVQERMNIIDKETTIQNEEFSEWAVKKK